MNNPSHARPPIRCQTRKRIAPFLLTVFLLPTAASADLPGGLLTLDAAVRLARAAQEPALASHSARADALAHAAVADAQLPDPRFTSGLANVPVDSPALDGADMTQITLGLSQEFPAGDTLALRGQQRDAQSREQRALRQARERDIILSTREAWLNVFYHGRVRAVLEDSIRAVVELLDSLSARFATGSLHAQDMLRTELELDLLRDQLTAHQQRAENFRARLGRRIGADAYAAMPESLPEFTDLPEAGVLQERLTNHPLVQALDARIDASRSGVALAEASYRPAFSLQAGYGIRTELSDFASIGVGVSMPLFTDKRQDRRRLAALRNESAEQLDRHALLLDLNEQLQREASDWEHLSRRMALYQRVVEERARQTAEASVSTYASGQTDFAELIRAQLAQLDVQLTRLELARDRGIAWSRLIYLAGEQP
ncbi:TolC family protein [Chromatocurvus halotolerans]|uniref:Outer membrane protein TolC n=1 Tax=Chromatocurvus halotolerans TaxID=1132028 RepID=A0A4R2KM54_9GAMM|nr:TolC family protein [Chromatocurvus halotolerans]TCO74514.1 outer membrane protein TolC [Chromatocurvus halotolerans]